MRYLGRFLDFVDRRKVVRRVQVLVLMWMLVDCYLWARGFAERSRLPGLELSAVMAAVTWPITALGGYVYRQYDNSRRIDSARATSAES